MELIISIGNIPLVKGAISPVTILIDPSASGMNHALSPGLDPIRYLIWNLSGLNGYLIHEQGRFEDQFI